MGRKMIVMKVQLEKHRSKLVLLKIGEESNREKLEEEENKIKELQEKCWHLELEQRHGLKS
jgi:hypothetical protein